LGDGYLSKCQYHTASDGYTRWHNSRYEEDHKEDDKSYLEWKATIMSQDFDVKWVYKEARTLGIKGHEADCGPVYRIYTNTSTELSDLRQIWYPDGQKIIPDYLDDFDSSTLTSWYYDDGTYHVHRQIIEISTDSFTLEDVKRLQGWLRDRWNIEAAIKRKPGHAIRRYYLHLNREASKRLLSLVEDVPSMERKKPMGWDGVFDRSETPSNFHRRLNARLSSGEKRKLIVLDLQEFYEQTGPWDGFPAVKYHYTEDCISPTLAIRHFGSFKVALESARLPTNYI